LKHKKGAVKKRSFFYSPFLGDRKNCLKVSNRAVGLPEDVHWYIEWRGLEVAKGIKRRKNSADALFFLPYSSFYEGAFSQTIGFSLPFAVRTIFTALFNCTVYGTLAVGTLYNFHKKRYNIKQNILKENPP
jgi:hypothetical protein